MKCITRQLPFPNVALPSVSNKPSSKDESEDATDEISNDICTFVLEDALEAMEEPYSRQTEVNKQLTQLVLFEYHILYSVSYEVPVLYFNATKSNGSCLDIETIWQNIPRVLLPPKYTQGQVATTDTMNTSSIEEHKMTGHSLFGDLITQVDHPFLAVPFFMLHPCGTRHLLSQVHTSKVSRRKEEKCPHSDTSPIESFDTVTSGSFGCSSSASPQLQFARRQSEREKNKQSIDLPSSSSGYPSKCFKDEANSSDSNIKKSVLSASTSSAHSSSTQCNKYKRKKRSILLSWLSSVAPIVGLKIDPAYASEL